MSLVYTLRANFEHPTSSLDTSLPTRLSICLGPYKGQAFSPFLHQRQNEGVSAEHTNLQSQTGRTSLTKKWFSSPFLDSIADLNPEDEKFKGEGGSEIDEMVQHWTLIVDDFVAAPHGDSRQLPSPATPTTVVVTPTITQRNKSQQIELGWGSRPPLTTIVWTPSEGSWAVTPKQEGQGNLALPHPPFLYTHKFRVHSNLLCGRSLPSIEGTC